MFFIFDRHHVATSEKEASVELRVYFGRHSEKSISTGVKLCADQWDNMVVNRVDAVQLNRQLHLFKKRYEDAIHLWKLTRDKPRFQALERHLFNVSSTRHARE